MDVQGSGFRWKEFSEINCVSNDETKLTEGEWQERENGTGSIKETGKEEGVTVMKRAGAKEDGSRVN
ncbi:hypothetical protein E2C01_082927 [Portunus trituberculatus]|uniref:Uncharacterized protein n=1 Tax=Portunus trituberculatus TaxID=210409 RepID=A0A5B7J352_PORTR|nr:hypothetical protein [Portunus trituberculatus]